VAYFNRSLIEYRYDEEPASKPAAPAPAQAPAPEPVQTEPVNAPIQEAPQNGGQESAPSWQGQTGGDDSHGDHSAYNAGAGQSYDNAPMEDDNYGPINVKEDG